MNKREKKVIELYNKLVTEAKKKSNNGDRDLESLYQSILDFMYMQETEHNPKMKQIFYDHSIDW